MDRGQRWSDLSARRRALVVVLIGFGLAIGVFIALHHAADFRQSAMGVVAVLSSGLGAVVCVLRALLAFRRRESWWMKGGMLLLALILAGLVYDAWAHSCCAPPIDAIVP